MKVLKSTEPVDRVPLDLLVFCFQETFTPLTEGPGGLVDWRLNGFISRLMRKKIFTGKLNEKALIPTGSRIEASSVLLVGIGKDSEKKELTLEKIMKSADQLGAKRIGLPASLFPIEDKKKFEKTYSKYSINETYLFH